MNTGALPDLGGDPIPLGCLSANSPGAVFVHSFTHSQYLLVEPGAVLGAEGTARTQFPVLGVRMETRMNGGMLGDQALLPCRWQGSPLASSGSV